MSVPRLDAVRFGTPWYGPCPISRRADEEVGGRVTEAKNHEGEAATERVERREERLAAHVRAEASGSVRLVRRVVDEPEAIDVTLRHGEVDLERQPADRPLEPGEQPVVERGDTTVVLVVEERLEVRKVPWVVEEIHLRGRLVTERRRITDSVRKERFEIQPQGDVELTNET